MAGDVAVEEVFDGFAALGEIGAFGDDADGGDGLVDRDEPDPGARKIEDVDVNEVGGFGGRRDPRLRTSYEPQIDRTGRRGVLSGVVSRERCCGQRHRRRVCSEGEKGGRS